MEFLLLESILKKEVSLEDVCKWLMNEQIEETTLNKILNYGCGQIEFVFYFLNHLREVTASFRAHQKQSLTRAIKSTNGAHLESVKSAKKLTTSQVTQSLETHSVDSSFNVIRKISQSKRCQDHSVVDDIDKVNGLGMTPSEQSINSDISDYLTSRCSTPINKSSPKSVEKIHLKTPMNSFIKYESSGCKISPVRDNVESDYHINFPKFVKHEIHTKENNVNLREQCHYLKNKNKSCDIVLHSSFSSRNNVNVSLENRKGSRFSDGPTFGSQRLSSGLCLGDFLPQKNLNAEKLNASTPEINNIDEIKSKDHRKRVRNRRINPTQLNFENISGQNLNSNVDANGFTQMYRIVEPQSVFKSEGMRNNSDVLIDDRNLLREECLKMQTSRFQSEVKINIPKSNEIEMKIIDCPSSKLVTYKEVLDLYANLYILILDKNLIVNIFNELYFLVSLMLTRKSEKSALSDGVDDQGVSENVYFNSIHNCVYFAVKVLLSELDILKILDRMTLKYLRETCDIRSFCPILYDCLGEFCNQKVKADEGSIKLMQKGRTNVCFIADTDNASNFPTVASFHSFKKQRDLFYEILRIWETEHLNAGWSFSRRLESKIASLMSLHVDSFNYIHLARLFKAQLLSSCMEDGVSFEDDSTPFLKNVSSAKLSLLQSRLTTSHTNNNVVNDFPGHQEFYRDFIIYANHYNFLRHLTDCFVHTLYEYDEVGLSICVLSKDDIDDEIRKEYISAVKSMKLLSKFLAVIDSLPYKSSGSITNLERLVNVQVKVRNEVQPCLDLKKIVNCSLTRCTLILTIPWVVEYLCFLDSISMKLSVYQEVLIMLFQIYTYLIINRTKAIQVNCTSNSIVNRFDIILNLPLKSKLMLRFCIGRLFDRAHLQGEFYFTWWADFLKNSTNHEYLMSSPVLKLNSYVSVKKISAYKHDEIQSLVTESDMRSDIDICKRKSRKKKHGNGFEETEIDSLDLIDESVLYTICPYLSELKTLLLTNTTKSNLTSRHITPVSTIILNDKAMNVKNLELQLEETFFDSHPPSMRKTVDFVSERVASGCVKYVCNTLVPSLKYESIIKIEEFRDKIISNKNDDSPDLKVIEAKLRSEVRRIADQCYSELKMNCCRTELCEKRCEAGLTALLAPDLKEPVVRLCIEYTARNARDKVLQWIQSRASEDIFIKDFDSEISRIMRNLTNADMESSKSSKVLSKSVLEINFDEKTSPVKVIDNIRYIIWNVLDNKKDDITIDFLINLTSDIYDCCTKKCDYFRFAFKTIIVLTLELVLTLVTHKPHLIDNEQILVAFIRIWATYSEDKKKQEYSKKRKRQSLINEDTFDAKVSDETLYVEDLDRSELPLPEVRTPSDDPFCRIICPRNIFMLMQSSDDNSWNVYARLLSRMLIDKILDTDDLSEQCTSLLRFEWPSNVLKCISKTFNVIEHEYIKTGGSTDKFTLLLEFLSETCEELDFY